MRQAEINEKLWQICENFKNKTEIKKNYIVYISALLVLMHYSKYTFAKIYKNRKNFYIGDEIDKELESIIEDKNLFSDIKFKNIQIYRDLGEENIISKTIKDIYSLLNDVEDEENIGKAYDYILEQVVYRNDILKEDGAFHTPAEIAKIMVNLTINQNEEKVYDPICGSGNFLKSAVEYNQADIYGRETNLGYYNIIKTRLLLNGIDNKNVVYDDKVLKNIKANVILTNPPFSDKSWKNNELNENSTVGEFVVSLLDKLEESGRMAVILPHGVLFKENEKRVREILVNENYIEAIVGLPENLFYNTRIPVIIMFISKNRKDENVLFIDASQDYESDKKNNILSKKYQDKIKKTYKEKKEIENYSHLAPKEEIIKNNYDLTIKKYVFKKKKEEVVDKDGLIQKVKKLKDEQDILEENIKDVLEALGYIDIGEKKNSIEHLKSSENLERENKEIDYSEIAKRIERARIEKGITKFRLALELDMSAAYLSRIERGVSTISVKTLMQICDALGVPESYILRGDEGIN